MYQTTRSNSTVQQIAAAGATLINKNIEDVLSGEELLMNAEVKHESLFRFSNNQLLVRVIH